MSVNCTNCGHPIPSGQFRCGKCGEAQARDSIEDFDLGEVAGDAQGLAREHVRELGVGPETRPRMAPVGQVPSEVRKRPEAQTGPIETRDEEDGPKRVPKGTFASDNAQLEDPPEKAVMQVERAQASAPRPDATTLRVATSAGASQPKRVRKVAPPYLASAILREDLAPSEPGKQALARCLVGSGVLGLGATLYISAGFSRFVFAPLFVALLLLSRVSLGYVQRAAVAGSVAGFGLCLATFWRASLSGAFEGPLLSASLTLLSSALYFRAWYRASAAARMLVGAALALCLGWAALTSHRGLLELGFDWASWLPALTWYVFVILCLLSLLAFMGDETTGGCDAWAIGLFLWFGLHAAVRYASEPMAPGTQALLGVVEPLFAAVSGVCLAQVVSRALGPTPRRVEAAAS